MHKLVPMNRTCSHRSVSTARPCATTRGSPARTRRPTARPRRRDRGRPSLTRCRRGAGARACGAESSPNSCNTATRCRGASGTAGRGSACLTRSLERGCATRRRGTNGSRSRRILLRALRGPVANKFLPLHVLKEETHCPAILVLRALCDTYVLHVPQLATTGLLASLRHGAG